MYLQTFRVKNGLLFLINKMPILKEFSLCWDEGQQQYYAFRPITGEVIYGASEDGDVSGLDRNFSAWRRPYEDQPYVLNIDVYSNDPNTDSWGRQRPMSDEKALELYEKHYDFETGFFFYVSKLDNETIWTKPPGVSANLPCDDLQDDNAFTFEQTADQQETIDNDMGIVAINDETLKEGGGDEEGFKGVWEEFYDENRSYWINSISNETTYENPNKELAIVPQDDTMNQTYDAYNDTTQYEITQNTYEEEEEDQYEEEKEVFKPITASSPPPAPKPPNAFNKKGLKLPEIVKPPPPREFIRRPPFGKDDVEIVRKRRSEKSYPGDTQGIYLSFIHAFIYWICMIYIYMYAIYTLFTAHIYSTYI